MMPMTEKEQMFHDADVELMRHLRPELPVYTDIHHKVIRIGVIAQTSTNYDAIDSDMKTHFALAGMRNKYQWDLKKLVDVDIIVCQKDNQLVGRAVEFAPFVFEFEPNFKTVSVVDFVDSIDAMIRIGNDSYVASNVQEFKRKYPDKPIIEYDLIHDQL
jgi:hypothetical protein